MKKACWILPVSTGTLYESSHRLKKYNLLNLLAHLQPRCNLLKVLVALVRLLLAKVLWTLVEAMENG